VIPAAVCAGLIFTGCQSNHSGDLNARKENVTHLERTEKMDLLEVGSEVERNALERFRAFYDVYSVERIQENIRNVYAEDAWFGDPFHTVQGIDDIEHYFVVMAEPVESCTFEIDSIQRSDKDYYIRWTMMLDSKAVKGEPIEAIGMSHVRFNRNGKIVFQQDYWDTSTLYDRLPVVGYWTRLVKNRLQKGLEQ